MSDCIVSSTVTGVTPVPAIIAVLVIEAPAAGGAYSLTVVSYTTDTFPPAGILIPETTIGGPA